jgi:hypothetical protein
MSSIDTIEDSRIIILTPNDDESNEFSLTYKQVSISPTIRAILEDDKISTHIPLNMNSKTMEYVNEYMKYKNGNAQIMMSKPVKKTMRESCGDIWDFNFIERVAKNRIELNSLYHAADYLAIDSLLHLIGAFISFLLIGKTKKEVYEILDIKYEERIEE